MEVELENKLVRMRTKPNFGKVKESRYIKTWIIVFPMILAWTPEVFLSVLSLLFPDS